MVFLVSFKKPLIGVLCAGHSSYCCQSEITSAPSIILPLGNYTAGAHHLNIIADVFNKDQHGFRLKDLDHKDGQNYDAVVHITSPAVLKLLSTIPDALETKYYLLTLKAIIDSFLDKEWRTYGSECTFIAIGVGTYCYLQSTIFPITF